MCFVSIYATIMWKSCIMAILKTKIKLWRISCGHTSLYIVFSKVNLSFTKRIIHIRENSYKLTKLFKPGHYSCNFFKTSWSLLKITVFNVRIICVKVHGMNSCPRTCKTCTGHTKIIMSLKSKLYCRSTDKNNWPFISDDSIYHLGIKYIKLWLGIMFKNKIYMQFSVDISLPGRYLFSQNL